jgi:hypothetical protein
MDESKSKISHVIDLYHQPAVIQEIAATLPRLASVERARALGPALVLWAVLHVHAQECPPAPRGAARNKLRKLEKTAALLQQELESLNHYERFLLNLRHVSIVNLRHVSIDHVSIDAQIPGAQNEIVSWVSDIRNRAKTALEIVRPTPGRRALEWRRQSMADLIAVFEYVTGTVATRRVKSPSYDDAGAEYGPFRSFALACLTPIEGANASVGLDHLIRSALQSMAGKRSQGSVIPAIIQRAKSRLRLLPSQTV